MTPKQLREIERQATQPSDQSNKQYHARPWELVPSSTGNYETGEQHYEVWANGDRIAIGPVAIVRPLVAAHNAMLKGPKHYSYRDDEKPDSGYNGPEVEHDEEGDL
jgi:hypothetical protein